MAQDMLAITLGFRATKKLASHPIFGTDKRKHIISQMMDVMADWRMSPFEFEGACRSGLRSALCLDGYSWQRADDEAASIIETCLKGHRRPTWLQGQPEGADRENCLGCGQLLDTSDRQMRRVSWCSDLCRLATKIRREEGDKYRGDRVTQRAFYLHRKQKRGKRPCDLCGEFFAPSEDGARFCSPRCAQRARPDRIEERTCEVCNAAFRPRDRLKAGKYCSKQCADIGKATSRPPRPCDHCNEIYKPHKITQRWCSLTCRSAGMKATTLAPRICDQCRETFQPARPKAKFCSAKCRNRAVYDRSKGK
ncbi:hypothetical protein NKH14_28760 [Mesorhizobium sp. M1380]|uniref:hypothetical protein n=1 Tax=Mesorhizobium sp. M1380 TaxID=2957093 RepID=UPI00333DBEED